MANLPETSNFDAGVYQLEVTDPVQGGASGVSNSPQKNLANRTRWLYDQITAIVASIAGLAPINSPTLTGTPIAPTPAAGDTSTKIATMAAVGAALGGVATVSVAGGANVTLAAAQYGLGTVILTGAITGNINVIFPTQGGPWIVVNSTTGAFSITSKTAGGSGIIVARATAKLLYTDGTNVADARTDFTDIAMLAGAGGGPTAPTQTLGDSTTKVATTGFVAAAAALLAPKASPTLSGTATINAFSTPLGTGSSSSSGRYTINLIQNNATSFLTPSAATLTMENATGNAGQFCYSGATSTVAALSCRVQSTAPSLLGLFYQSTGVGGITTNGSTITVVGTSDARAKTVDSEYDPGDVFDRITIYNYTWKTGANAKGIGPLAQELYVAAPHLVKVGDETNADLGSEEYVAWTTSVSETEAMLMAEVKALRRRMAAMESKMGPPAKRQATA